MSGKDQPPGEPAARPKQARSIRTRATLLEAAAEVVRREGVGGLTLERVADTAGVSKGGLLYHFGSKRELVLAMVDETLASAGDDLEQLADRTPGAGAFARAYLDYVRSGERTDSDEAASVFAAATLEPEGLASAQRTFGAWQERLRHDDGIDDTVALLARVVGDGLWLIDLFGLAPPDAAGRAAVCDLVLAMLDDAAS